MPSGSPIAIPDALYAEYAADWRRGRILFFSAPCGCGKTASAQALLKGRRFCELEAEGTPDFAEQIPRGCEAVFIDDLQRMRDETVQQSLCALIRARTDLMFLICSRGPVPGWLMPFQFAGVMTVIGQDKLLLDTAAVQKLMNGNGVTVDAATLHRIQKDMKGYPVAICILCRRLSDGAVYNRALFEQVQRELFLYFDDAVFRRFSVPTRGLLMQLSFFEQFDLHMAQMISGDPDAGECMGCILRDTSMLTYDGVETYRIKPIFKLFLQWEAHQSMSVEEQQAMYNRAALHYELSGDLASALECYEKAGAQHKISELLIKNAELHPGVGHYHEMEKYYFALPREEILRSPALICGMSMLSSMCLDYTASEEWYQELQNYAARLKKTDGEYKEVRGRLAYLDIALPQRGSKGLVDVIANVFRVMSEKELKVPAFSVTSTLPSIMNGGKDFCEWSKKDDVLYATMRGPVEAVLGRDGIGLADCAICESKFEKGEDVSARLLNLMGRLGEIQTRGTPDIEFAVVGLLAKVQISQGRIQAARNLLENLRTKFSDNGETRFLPNIDAALCRVMLHLNDAEGVDDWLEKRAPHDNVRLRALWRYQYLTLAMVQLANGEYSEALMVLARLLPYCEYCGRVMDGIHIRLLMALCHYRRGDAVWNEEFEKTLELCQNYAFIWPIAQYGTAVLPLLQATQAKMKPAWFNKLLAATRAQAVHYPNYLQTGNRLAEPLSAAEMQVLRLLCFDKSNSEIGEVLGIRLSTVKSHVSHIMQKLGVSRRSEAKHAAEMLHLI